MKKSTFFAIESSNKKKVRNFVKLAKRMGVDYNDDFTAYGQQDNYQHLGFSNTWDQVPPKALRCSFTHSTSDVVINIDSADGYINAVNRLIQEINNVKEEQKFDDKHGNELFVGNTVTLVDIEDLEVDLKLGDLLTVTKLIDKGPNYIEFRSIKNQSLYSFYGHRVVKVIYG